MIKKIISTVILLVIFNIWTTNAYFYNEYYWESIEAFISSPSSDELKLIDNDINRYCEEIYLEATRRREYSEIELAICSEIFEVKRQQEVDYIMYMFRNRGIN